MLVSKLLNHATELHHVDGSAGDLGGDQIILSLLNKVLSNYSQKLTHIGVTFDHILKALHLVDSHQLFLQHSKLLQLLIRNLMLLLHLGEMCSGSAIASFLLHVLMSLTCLLLHGFLVLQVIR